jgi:TRAP-type uncharacterized transport system fused permease subunit
MGAAAFIMADYLQMPYGKIVVAAAIPALLYFSCVLLCINLEARYRDLPPISKDEFPDVFETLKVYGHMLVPLSWLAYRIFAGHDVTSLLIVTMVATLVLGAGMPTASAYIMGAVLIVPALVEFGMDPMICHFFVFYFAIMSMLTPPVALSAYAAASIAETSPSKTGWQAMLLALPGFIIPFAFVVHPGLLLIGDLPDTLHGLLVTGVSLSYVGAAVVGWLFFPLPMAVRMVLQLLAVGALWPDKVVSLTACAVGAAGIAGLYLAARAGAKRLDAPGTAPEGAISREMDAGSAS